MKKFISVFAFWIPLVLFSQETSQKDSIVKMAGDLFKIIKMEKAVLSKQAKPDSADLIEDILFRGRENYGKSVPDFNAVSLTGKRYSRELLEGKVTFINFWFEKCPPCIAEFEALNELYKKYKDNKNFQFLSFTWEKKEKAERIAKQYGLKYPILSINPDCCRTLINHVRGGYPTNLIADRKVKIQFYLNGGPTDPEEAKKWKQILYIPILEELLNTSQQ